MLNRSLVLGAAVIATGCALEPVADAPSAPGASGADEAPAQATAPATKGSLAPEINGGEAVNAPGEEADTVFPYMTVSLTGPQTSSGKTPWCTGVIISPTQILTAAHCTFTSFWHVGYYGSSKTGAEITTTGIWSSIQVPPAYPPGVTGITGVGTTGLTTTASPKEGYNSGDFADLAIVTLTAPIPAAYPYAIAPIGPSGGYTRTPPSTAWEVGVGNHNDVTNDGEVMDWVPIILSSNSDDGGWFQTSQEYFNEGDSGGPVYEYASDGSRKLVVVGIASGEYYPYVLNQYRYSSVEYPPTYKWIQEQLVAPAVSQLLAPGEDHVRVPIALIPSFLDAGATDPSPIEIGGRALRGVYEP